MDSIKTTSTIHHKSRFARTLQKVCNLRTTASPTSKFDYEDEDDYHSVSSKKSSNKKNRDEKEKAVLQAVIAKIFASITSIKVAYSEIQMAQNPYDGDAIQVSDQAVVDELRSLSDLKRSFLKKELNLSPQVTLMLAEVQEQQSLMRTYEIMIKKFENEAKQRETNLDSLKKQLTMSTGVNRSIEKQLNATGAFPMFVNVRFQDLNLSHFVQVLQYCLRSVRSFVKLMVREMEAARWDLAAAANVIEPSATDVLKPSHRCFTFESFVCKKMLENFEFSGSADSLSSSLSLSIKPSREECFGRFKNISVVDPTQYLTRNPNSSFAKFTRLKYTNVVHAKMECSFFGNLNHRKLVNSGGFPDTGFFTGFAEMSKRVWLLRCLASSLNDDVSVFQVKNGCRFSDVYMQNMMSDESLYSSGASGDIRVGFTVVPGFKIGKSLIQSQVYLCPA